MSNRKPQWVSTDTVLLTLIVVVSLAALWVYGIGGAASFIDPLLGDGDTQYPVRGVTIGAALLLIVAMLFRGLIRSGTKSDRVPIVETAPERVTENTIPFYTGVLQEGLETSVSVLSSPSVDDRKVAVYGNQLRESDRLPEYAATVFDELETTAVAVIVAQNNITREEAVDRVRSGRWTDDRIVATYLRSKPTEGESFTLWERIQAWVQPEKVFMKRIERIIAEIEQLDARDSATEKAYVDMTKESGIK